ncbi:SLATT domain-containing protein [Nocardia gipuzkoensis]
MTREMEEHLTHLLSKTIAKHDKRKNQLRRANWTLRIGAMVLGGISTVILGLQIDSDSYTLVSRNIALVISAVLTLITSLHSFWDLDNYWLKRKVIYNELVLLGERLDFLKASDSPIKEIELNKLFSNYLEILGKHSEYWEMYLNKGGEPSSTQADTDTSRSLP